MGTGPAPQSPCHKARTALGSLVSLGSLGHSGHSQPSPHQCREPMVCALLRPISSHGPETWGPGGRPVGTAAAPGPPRRRWDPVLKAPRTPGSARSPAISHNLTLALRPSEGNSGPGTGPSPVPRAQGVAFSDAKEGASVVSPSSLVQ